MYRIGIFENVLVDIKDGFELINDYDFDNQLDFKYYTSSQSFGDLKGVLQFDLLFIDIALSSNSDLDGIHLIKQILELKETKLPKMVIITGQSKVQDLLKEHNLTNIPVTQKPFIADEVSSIIKKELGL